MPITGSHLDPDPNIAIIGRSGKIRDCNDWSVIEFPLWTANKDFQNIAINVFTNDLTTSKIWIDNVTLCETNGGYESDTIAIDAVENPIMPIGYGSVTSGLTCIPEPEEDELFNGSLIDLYGQLNGCNGTTNWYENANDKCWSLGGTLLDEVLNYNCDDSLEMGIKLDCGELQKAITDPVVDVYNYDRHTYLPPLGNITDACPNFQFPSDVTNVAFRGKDIIYIHGLELGHLASRIVNIPLEATENWPDNETEFYSGYYKQAAKKTWKDHINYFAKGQGYLNRYLVVSYNCSQRMDVAIHCVLTQIREAMETGRGVENPNPLDSRKTGCFGRDYVIISQSTGAIIGDALLSIANKTKTDPNTAIQYGNIGIIGDRCKGHIARRGAFTGSDLATILVAVANQISPTTTIITAALALQKVTQLLILVLIIPLQSILVDLIPKLTRSKWGPYLNQVPIPVVTISGGHPSFFTENQLALTSLLPLSASVTQAVALRMKHI